MHTMIVSEKEGERKRSYNSRKGWKMRDRRERESKNESDKRIEEKASTKVVRGEEREKERFGKLDKERERETRTEGERDGRTRRVLTKLTGADLRRNLTNSGLNPPTRAVDLSCLPVNLAAVLVG